MDVFRSDRRISSTCAQHSISLSAIHPRRTNAPRRRTSGDQTTGYDHSWHHQRTLRKYWKLVASTPIASQRFGVPDS